MGCISSQNASSSTPVRSSSSRVIRRNSTTYANTYGRTDLPRVLEELQNKCREEERKVVAKVLKGEYVGEGIRRTKAYETHLSKEELEKVRENFWETRNDTGWKLLKIICEAEYPTALNMVKDCGIVLYNNNIRISFSPSGEIYCLPIYVINPPKRYQCDKDQHGTSTKSDSDSELKVPGKPLNLKVRSTGKVSDLPITISSLKKGKDLKLEYAKQTQTDGKKIRLFCVGQEIADHTELYKYNLADEFVLIVLLV